MDSKSQDDMRGELKLISSLVLILIELIIINCWGSNINKLLEEKSINCISINYEYEKGLPNIISQVINTNTNDDIKLNNYQVENIKSTSYLLTKKESVDNNFKNLNTKVNGFAISIEDNIFGYVTEYEQREAIVLDVCQKYINQLGLKQEDISKIIVNGKIEATPDILNIAQLSNNGEISQEIYNASIIDNEILGVKMTVRLSEEEIIKPEIIVENDENLYMGDESISEGIDGSKLVFKEISYDGLNVTNERIISEEILYKANPIVVKKGIKNPYMSGVEFLLRPTNGGYLSSSFGEYRFSSYHKGIDFAKNIGEEVYASISGKVAYAGYNDGGYGNLIIIQHDNNMKTYYAHLNDIYVSEGTDIRTGDVIGTIGNTGFSTGPHLHFELRVNDEPVNPINFIIS